MGMRIPNIGETELLVPLHGGVFEQPIWGSFLRSLRQVAAVAGALLVVRTATARDDLELVEGDVAGVREWLSETMRDGRVYSRAELSRPDGSRDFRAIRLHEALGLEAWLALADAQLLDAEHSSLLSALAPHLRVALQVLAALEQEKARASVSVDAFRRMNFGWLSIDHKCRIVDCDPQAERFLDRSASLRRGPYDRLTPSRPAIDRQLSILARDFAADRRHRPRAINLNRDPWIDILVSPMRLEALGGDSRAVAIVYLRGDRSSSSDRHEQLVDLFDLTPAEARLAWSLAQGLSIAEAAAAHGLTVETARYYSKKIYAKTGARGQVDLVRNILTGVLALA